MMWRYRDVAVMWFAIGMLFGLIFAFASCAPQSNDLYVPMPSKPGVAQ